MDQVSKGKLAMINNINIMTYRCMLSIILICIIIIVLKVIECQCQVLAALRTLYTVLC